MRSTGGVKMNWPLVAIAFAVIGVPMGVALIQDLGKDGDDDDLLARIGQVNDITAKEESPGDPDLASLESADDIAGRWHEPAMDQAFFDEVFLGGPEDKRPALRGPLASVRWDEPVGDEVVHDLTAGWPRIRLGMRSPDGFDARTSAVVVYFPDDGTAERVFTSRWGEPLLVAGTDDTARRIWSNPDQQLKLVLEQHDGQASATFAQSIPAAELIGANHLFAFESYPLLGATPEVLAEKYGARFALDADGTTGKLECPGVEVSEHAADCVVSFANGKAVRIAVTIDHMFDPDGGPHLFAALRSALGDVRQQAGDEQGNAWIFGHGYTVTQVAGTAAITVERTSR